METVDAAAALSKKKKETNIRKIPRERGRSSFSKLPRWPHCGFSLLCMPVALCWFFLMEFMRVWNLCLCTDRKRKTILSFRSGGWKNTHPTQPKPPTEINCSVCGNRQRTLAVIIQIGIKPPSCGNPYMFISCQSRQWTTLKRGRLHARASGISVGWDMHNTR